MVNLSLIKHMKIKTTLFILLLLMVISTEAPTPKNLTLLGSLTIPGQSLAGCWHYNSPSGGEYALLGAANGIVIVDITDPSAPNFILQTPGVSSLWHEVKVQGDYAYAVSEGNDPGGLLNGLQIIDLRYLPDSAPSKFYTGDGAIFNQLSSAHTVTIEGQYVYVNGHNINSLGRGVLIFDIADPWNPVYTGAITSNYCHDSFVRGDTLYSSEIYAGQFSIFDISDRTSPSIIATQTTPALFNHDVWLSDNGQFLFATDEKANAPMTSYDVSDFTNITQLDTFLNGNFSTSEVHNVRVLNDFVVSPSYGSQLTIVDGSRPHNMIEVASYTTGNSLCWDADPYTTSGNIIATDMNSGVMYVFGPTYQRACYLEGNITDSLTGISLNGVSVTIPAISIAASSVPSGNYATGYADSGSYQVIFSKAGYVTKTFTVNLSNGQLVTLDVQLVDVNTGISGSGKSIISVYPNPVGSMLNLSCNGENFDQLIIYDVLGKVVIDDRFDASLSNAIDVSGLPKGKYTARLSNKTEIRLVDFIK